MSIYEVYKCKLGDEIVYVGQGAKGRHKHCNSGCSHVYELNKMHFEGIVFDVQVIVVLSKEGALSLEDELIQRYKPRFNTVGVTDARHKAAETRKLFKKALKDDIRNSNITANRKLLMYLIIEEFFKYHTHKDLTEQGLTLRGHGVYKTSGLKLLATCINNMKLGKGTESDKATPYHLQRILNKYFKRFYDHPVNEVVHC